MGLGKQRLSDGLRHALSRRSEAALAFGYVDIPSSCGSLYPILGIAAIDNRIGERTTYHLTIAFAPSSPPALPSRLPGPQKKRSTDSRPMQPPVLPSPRPPAPLTR